MEADGGVDLCIEQAKFHQQFAQDVSSDQAALTEKSGAPAWKDLPSLFVYGDGDKNIPPQALEFLPDAQGSSAPSW